MSVRAPRPDAYGGRRQDVPPCADEIVCFSDSAIQASKPKPAVPTRPDAVGELLEVGPSLGRYIARYIRFLLCLMIWNEDVEIETFARKCSERRVLFAIGLRRGDTVS